MTHNAQHVIIHKIREFLSAWPLSSVGVAAALGALTRFIG